MAGQWRDGFPRMTLTLLGREQLNVDFVVDTGFNGDIALPEYLVSHLGISPSGTHFVELAGGFRQRCFSFEIAVEWEGEERIVEVLTLDGNPLIGNNLWVGRLLQAENNDGAKSLLSSFKQSIYQHQGA